MTSYSIADFVADIAAIVAVHDDDRQIVDRVIPLARRLIGDKSWIRPEYFDCDEAQGFGIAILNEEADHGLLVETICWLPGRGVAPHDHQTWGVVIGIEGEEINVNWRRDDDATVPGHAVLCVAEEIVVGEGEALAFMPDDIHSVCNEGATPSLSLHVYGKALSSLARSEFDPVGQIQRPCPQRVRRVAN